MRIVKLWKRMKKLMTRSMLTCYQRCCSHLGHPSLTDTFHGSQEASRCCTSGESEVQVTKYTNGLPYYFILDIPIKIIQNVS